MLSPPSSWAVLWLNLKLEERAVIQPKPTGLPAQAVGMFKVVNACETRIYCDSWGPKGALALLPVSSAWCSAAGERGCTALPDGEAAESSLAAICHCEIQIIRAADHV